MPSIVSPVDGSIATTYEEPSLENARELLERARAAQKACSRMSLAERQKLCLDAYARYGDHLDESATLITRMMGKPVGQARGEYQRSMKERVEALVNMALAALADVVPPARAGLTRRTIREPVGLVLVIAAWNYPLLVPTNTLFAAVLAGNAVVLKHAPQTMAVGAQLARAFEEAGAPPGLVTHLPASHDTVARLLAERAFGYVAFTGSVRGGHEVARAAASEGFLQVGLELGGNDAAVVFPDCDLENTVENVVDGAFYNSGQSCCAIKRVLVHSSLHERFVEAAAELVKKYVVGDPLEAGTTLGPVVSAAAADRVRAHVADALASGGRRVVDPSAFAVPTKSPCYLAPELIDRASPRSLLMVEETFGPALGVTSFDSDEEAIQLVNDQAYGLTASLWTKDAERADRVGRRLDVGTVFMNRCDYLDPEMPWTGTKDSGSGVSLSPLGFLAVTRPKNLHFQ
jgi:acyl-CoA reductase-like NAD-dependent aldehyde dehydrogenase